MDVGTHRSDLDDEPVVEDGVAGEITPLLERTLSRAGLPAYVPGVVSATPSLRLPWLGAAVIVSFFAAWGAAADPDRALLFLLVAPIVPVAGVAAAYGPWADPMFETVQSTPVSGFHVLLARSLAVLATAIVLLGVAAVVVPGASVASWAWVLPALALSLSSLVLSTFMPLPRAAAAVTGAWCAVIFVAAVRGGVEAVFGGPGQLGFAAVAVGASFMVARRRERFEVQGLRARQALIDAADLERRRIERNIHDGAQQQLVAIGVKAGLARAFVTKDPDRAIATLDEIRFDAQEAVEGLRDMTRGACPPILADDGLAAALEVKARRSPVPITIDADGVGRVSASVEIAAYYCCVEAIQNATKYSGATKITVSVRRQPAELALSVCDDGVGFDPLSVRRGVGMRSMAERVEALGGTLDVRSSAGAGTIVSARIPLAG